MANIDKIFDSIGQRTLFKDKTVLQSNYSPEDIPYRDKQIDLVASILAPALIGQKTSNLFIYGKTGTGKTLTIQFVQNELLKRAKDSEHPMRIEYINCKLKKVADTEYRLLAELIKKMGGDIPPTGLPTDQVYNKFLTVINNSNHKLIIIILDEIDQLVKKISENYHLPYYTISPTFSVCPIHGYLAGEHEFCPKCDEESGYTDNVKKLNN